MIPIRDIKSTNNKYINKYKYDPKKLHELDDRFKELIGRKDISESDILGDLINIACRGQGSISEYWRKNTSSFEASELANVLRALNKVSGHIGRNVGNVEWLGMSTNTNGRIILDPGVILGKYPVPPKRFDYLVGIVVHEALHQTEWSEYLWKLVDKSSPGMRMSEKVIFQKIVYTGEDIYVDLLSEKSILGQYTRITRTVAMNRASRLLKKKVAPGNKTVDELFLIWWQTAFGYDIQKIDRNYKKPLNILSYLTAELKRVSCIAQGPVERCGLRSRLYLESWKKIKDILSSWTIIDKMLCWYPEVVPINKKQTSKQRDAHSRLSKTAIQNIEERLAYNSSDITPIIRSIAGPDNETIVPTSRWDFNISAHPVIDYKMVARLKSILETYSDRKIVLNRGLTSGRIDRRKLYRAPINGRCFFEKQKLPFLNWDICLLVDASGSMNGPKWQLVENTLGTIHKAFSGFKNRLQAYGYFEIEGVCMISSLIKGNKILSIPPNGLTASGQAIIAAAYLMPNEDRRRFIVHITDGESNFGCDVRLGINHCINQNIHLVTLGVAYKNRNTMQKQYGKSIQFIDHFEQLPSAIEKLLQWTLSNKTTKRIDPSVFEGLKASTQSLEN